MLNENNNNNRFIFYFCFWDKSRRRFWGNLGDCLLLGTSFVYRDISFFRSNRPTSEGDCSPSGQGFLRVTQKVSSNSIHTLLCSDEHKIRLRADCGRTDFNRSIKPSDSSCRLDAKPRLPRRLFKKQKRQTSPFRQHHAISGRSYTTDIFVP